MYSFQGASTKVMSSFSAAATTVSESCSCVIMTAAARTLLVLCMTYMSSDTACGCLLTLAVVSKEYRMMDPLSM